MFRNTAEGGRLFSFLLLCIVLVPDIARPASLIDQVGGGVVNYEVVAVHCFFDALFPNFSTGLYTSGHDDSHNMARGHFMA